jgi:signal transduction histidine kinase
MKKKRFTIFRRIGILFFALITILCLLFMSLTYFSVSNFHEASTELLNKDVAAHIAKFTSPFKDSGINLQKADSVFYDAMVLSPSAEVYFLDTYGKVIAYHADEKEIRQWMVPVAPIKKLISAEGKQFIKNADPRDKGANRIFSAAEVWNGNKKLGYIYVILGSNTNVSQMLYTSYFGGFLIKVVLVIILLTILFTFFYIKRLQRSFDRLLLVLERFQNGDLKARFPDNVNDELLPVTKAFNKMADMLAFNIDRLTKSEKERKDFVANISHDLRTPLSVARGYTETLLMKGEEQVVKEQREEFLQLVYRKIRQVESMVNQLFELSKMEAVTFTPHKEPFVFSEILQEIVYDAAADAAEKKVRLDCSTCEDASLICADIRMMERVIQNLVVNAIKYTAPGGWVHSAIERENGLLKFSIQNSAPAINEQMQAWFNDNIETDLLIKRPSNTGIGLVIVKKILQLHLYRHELITDMNSNTFNIYIPVQHALASA